MYLTQKHYKQVNYVKFIDIWFLVCTFFIFFSLLEFAIVNTIWRRKYVEISKIYHSTSLFQRYNPHE